MSAKLIDASRNKHNNSSPITFFRLYLPLEHPVLNNLQQKNVFEIKTSNNYNFVIHILLRVRLPTVFFPQDFKFVLLLYLKSRFFYNLLNLSF